ncbi:putative ion transporter superfamily protein YfcC [Arthrobacter sp. AG258]|uniref:YfcC family protein n=1 Tax=Arthrobacter sp. AG258 TaxID=2183899 RepID=UPI00105CE826|nr:AbgT family transporter [Arthrobacter sp. AG258]TDT74710.1 putative ion transporter superfamily protein YfcC [Arthrobacter sp. AG258]
MSTESFTSEVVQTDREQQQPRGDLNAYVVVAVIIVLAAIATWLIPAGVFDRQINPSTNVKAVVPGTYHAVEQTPVGPWDVFLHIQSGLVSASSIIFFILAVGGCFGLLSQGGGVTALMAKVITRFHGKAYEKWSFIFIFAVLFACSASFGFAEQGIIFVPFMVMLAIAMGYDALLAVAVVVCATAIGYAGSVTGPFNVAIAQNIAELPLYSGSWFRIIAAVVLFCITAVYIFRYASKIKKDPSKSLVSHLDFSDVEMPEDPQSIVMTGRQKASLIIFGLAIVFMVVSMLVWKWGLPQLTGYFILVGLLIGLASRLKASEIADGFIDGSRQLLFAALLVGFARAVQIILEQGQVIDSLINALVQPLAAVPGILVPGLMVVVQSLINLVIPSSSAMAVVTMPIMTPLADLLEVQRQTAVIAYQFGDGITNLILPSYSVLMAALGLARVPFGKWFRFIWPLTVILLGTVIVLAMIAEMLRVGPF